MAATSLKISDRLHEAIRAKTDEMRSKSYHPGLIVSLALELWAEDKWVPGPDLDEPVERHIVLKLEDDAYEKAIKKRSVVGCTTSPIMRRALQDWVDGKFEIRLVRA